jgi:hypothetical protein
VEKLYFPDHVGVEPGFFVLHALRIPLRILPEVGP